MTIQPVKADTSKNRLDLISTVAIEELGWVLTYGASKYSEHNWRNGSGLAWSRVLAAALRHLFAFQRGQDLDPETGRPHLAHAMACVMFLLEYQLLGTGQDDRWRPVTEMRHVSEIRLSGESPLARIWNNIAVKREG